MKQLNDTEKPIEDDNKSVFTVDLDLERQVNLLTDDDEDDILNEAKINFGNESSNWSSNSYLFNSTNNLHNMTTPVPQTNNIFYPTMENEDKYSNNINKTNLANTNCTSLANNINFINNIK